MAPVATEYGHTRSVGVGVRVVGGFLNRAWSASDGCSFHPFVQPRRGPFPELVAATRGGILHEPERDDALAEKTWALYEQLV